MGVNSIYKEWCSPMFIRKKPPTVTIYDKMQAKNRMI